MSKLIILLAPLLLLASCASTGIHSPGEGEPLRVTLITSGGASRFEVANAVHTDPVAHYSSTRTRGSIKKIASDELVLDMIDFLGSYNYGKYERIGSIKKSAVAAYARAFEIETSAGISHWGVTKLSDLDELKSMTACFDHFFNQVFNKIEAYQSVENKDGEFQFRKN